MRVSCSSPLVFVVQVVRCGVAFNVLALPCWSMRKLHEQAVLMCRENTVCVFSTMLVRKTSSSSSSVVVDDDCCVGLLGVVSGDCFELVDRFALFRVTDFAHCVSTRWGDLMRPLGIFVEECDDRELVFASSADNKEMFWDLDVALFRVVEKTKCRWCCVGQSEPISLVVKERMASFWEPPPVMGETKDFMQLLRGVRYVSQKLSFLSRKEIATLVGLQLRFFYGFFNPSFHTLDWFQRQTSTRAIVTLLLLEKKRGTGPFSLLPKEIVKMIALKVMMHREEGMEDGFFVFPSLDHMWNRVTSAWRDASGSVRSITHRTLSGLWRSKNLHKRECYKSPNGSSLLMIGPDCILMWMKEKEQETNSWKLTLSESMRRLVRWAISHQDVITFDFGKGKQNYVHFKCIQVQEISQTLQRLLV